MSHPNVIFMGTPEFAVPCLNALYTNRFHVPLVVTQPDRPKGRGRKLTPPPVKETALKFGSRVLQPESIKTDSFYDTLREYPADFFVVVAFGHLLPGRLLSLPRLGSINIHASLLPKYRGPAPIQWAIIRGEKETGVTSMRMDEKIDTGGLLIQEKIEIHPDDTASTLHDRLSLLGANVLIKTLKGLAAGNLVPIPQESSKSTYAPMLKKEDGRIDWNLTAEKIESFIRGMNPWPGAFTFWKDKRLKIFKGIVAEMPEKRLPGTVLDTFTDELRVAAGKGALLIEDLQGDSGKRMQIRDFLKGRKIPPGEILY